MSTYLITGCAKGLGLSMASLLAARPESEVRLVFATARRESEALQRLVDEYQDRVVHVQLEVTDEKSVNTAVDVVRQKLGNGGLDVLVNNAGILNFTKGGILEMDDLMSTMATNVLGVHNVTKTFMPLLLKGHRKVVLNMTSAMSSITHAATFMFQPTPAYKISKTALNMLTVQYSEEYKDKGFTFALLDPGWVQTDMGTSAAVLTVEQSTRSILDKLDQLSGQDTGKFFEVFVPDIDANKVPGWLKGGEVPW